MSHECEDCGGTFQTLTRLRLHDCPGSTSSEDEPTRSAGSTDVGPSDVPDRRPPTVDIDTLDVVLQDQEDREDPGDGLYQALAIYESKLDAVDDAETVRGIRRAYRRPLVEFVDDATQQAGWAVLDDVIEAYQPGPDEQFPHVTTIVLNVVGRFLIQSRLTDGIEEVPVEALEYFEALRLQLEDHHDGIREGLHTYGWGIGHPDVDVADRIHDHAAEDVFSTNAMLEHAFYADQHTAVDLLERLLRDESIQESYTLSRGETTASRYLLDAPAGAVSEFTPTIPRYWDWEAQVGERLELADDVEQRIRSLVVETGIDAELPVDWTIADLTL